MKVATGTGTAVEDVVAKNDSNLTAVQTIEAGVDGRPCALIDIRFGASRDTMSEGSNPTRVNDDKVHGALRNVCR